MRHFLFVCSQNKLRSPTAEHLFAELPGIATASAGTNNDAANPLIGKPVVWADFIFVMERQHRTMLQKKHKAALKDKRLIMLDIPDEYEFMDPALVQLLRAKMLRWIPSA